jgi:hypothetical protein
MKYINKENLGKAKQVLGKASDLFGNRFFLLSVIVVMVMLTLKQCGEADHAKAEALREHNNYLASLDSVRTIKNELGHIIQEKATYELKASELSKEQKDLIAQLDLKSNGRGNTPNSVINVVTEIRDSVNVASTIIKDPNSDESINFVHNPQMTGNNKLKITGKTPYVINLQADPSNPTKYVASIVPGLTSLLMEQNIDITTGIYRDPKTKRMMTRVSTTYPGLTFNDVNSFDITDSPDTRKALKAARKEFGLGIQVGYGLSGSNAGITPGFYIGAGIHYSPKFLQFGK